MTDPFDPAETPIPRRPASVVDLPLAPQQLRWWFLLSRYPDASAPIVSLVHRLRGPLVVDAWLAAVNALANRHESLRVLFIDRPDGPMQAVGPPDGLVTEQIDLTGLPRPEREDRARELLNERREVVLDLQRGPLAASCLVRLADDDHVWTLTVHHILSDGASLDIVDRELGVLYRAYVDGVEPDLPELAVQYGDYALWLQQHTNPAELDDLEYWTEQLAGVSPLELQTDSPRPPQKGDPAAEVRSLLDLDLQRRIEELARSARSTRFMVLLAGLQVLLYEHSGQNDFCVGVPILGAARSRPELAPVFGLFNNSLALRCDLSGDPTFRTLLANTRDTVMDALDHQEVTFGRVAGALNLPPDASRAQVFQVMFGMDENDAAGGLRLPDVLIEEFPLAIPKVLHDLMLFAWPVPDGLTTRFLYDTGLFSGATMTGMSRRYEDILRAAVKEPDARLSALA